MAKTVNVHEAKTNFSKLLARVMAGEQIIIAKAGVPVARMIPLQERKKERVPGTAKGQIIIGPDFDAPLPEEWLKAFEG